MATDRAGATAPVEVSASHDGLYYDSDDDLVQFAVPFLRQAAAKKETAFVVGGPHTRELLAPVLDGLGGILFVPAPQVFTRTATALLVYQELVEDALAKGARGVRALSEIDFGSTPEGLTENLRFEAVANIAFGGQPLWNVCLYDVRRRPEQVLDASARAHPHLVFDQRRTSNPTYLHPAELLRRHSQTRPYDLEAHEPSVEVLDLRAAGLAELRVRLHLVARRESALSTDRVDEFIEAVNELVTNALEHGAGRVDLRLWAHGEQLVCTITDQGQGFDDPLAGFVPVPIDTLPQNGAGLWLARNFTDSLDVTHSGRGFTARVSSWSRRDPGHAPR